MLQAGLGPLLPAHSGLIRPRPTTLILSVSITGATKMFFTYSYTIIYRNSFHPSIAILGNLTGGAPCSISLCSRCRGVYVCQLDHAKKLVGVSAWYAATLVPRPLPFSSLIHHIDSRVTVTLLSMNTCT